jgi:hypothetical protein
MFLPYGLKFKSIGFNRIEKMIGLTNDKIIFEIDDDVLMNYYDLNYNGKPGVISLLRPLSQLTKEIEHNGKKFVPIVKVYMGIFDGEEREPDIIKNDFEFITLHWDETNESFGGHIDYDLKNIKFWEFGIIQKLAEWHFDIYDFIGRGLAEPIK